MKLSIRLQAIYNFVDEGSIVADVGCDHGLLSCALAIRHRSKKVYACDIAELPLEQAKRTIKHYSVENSVFAILSDGIQNVEKDADTLIIAGLGYDSIHSILNHNLEKLKQFKKIIIQSNREIEKIRMFISEHNFKVIEECCVFDIHYYQVISFCCDYDKELSNNEIMFGKKMNKNNVFQQMWLAKMNKYEAIIKKLDAYSQRYRELQILIQAIQKEIEG
ncbi:MAG: tRNA (adenine(22)-N(1))-methyltransferase [Breznakia sp.]